jgi:hypothetical protein
VALWPVPQKMLLFGTRSPSSGVAAEVEYERVTVWELPATPKK